MFFQMGGEKTHQKQQNLKHQVIFQPWPFPAFYPR